MRAIYRSAAAAIALTMPATGWAQSDSQPEVAAPGAIQDIVVTANRREERLQNVGASISACLASSCVRWG